MDDRELGLLVRKHRKEIEAAMQYYQYIGMQPIPLCNPAHLNTWDRHIESCKGPGKRALISWKTHSETTVAMLDEWNSKYKYYNIGIKMGSVTGLVGIDVDGPEGEELLQKMSNGEVPETWEYATGAGRRLLYSIPKTLKTKKVKETGEGDHNECALLCEGQYTVVPPSIHKSGTMYQWDAEKNPEKMDCTPAPKWILDLITDDKPTTGTIDLSKVYVPEDKWEATEFDCTIPEMIQNGKAPVDVKASKGNTQTEVDKIWEQVISEGGRDNAMTLVVGRYVAMPDIRKLGKDTFASLVHAYNLKYMSPPLEDAAVNEKIEHFWEIEAQKTAEYKAKERKKFNAKNQIAPCLKWLADARDRHLTFDKATRSWYMLNTKYPPWRTANEETISDFTRLYLMYGDDCDEGWEPNAELLTKAIRADVTGSDIAEDEEGVSKFDIGAKASKLSKYIPINGRLYDWKNEQWSDWDDEFEYTYNFRVPHCCEENMDRRHDYGVWQQVLDNVIPNKDTQKVLQMFLGTALVPKIKWQQFVFLTGSGNNGKSTIIETIEQIITSGGVHLLSKAKPSELEEFKLQKVMGALLNVATEFEGDSRTRKMEVTKLKELTSGNTLQSADIKYRNGGLPFYNTVKFIFDTNSMPKVDRFDPAFVRRFVPIPCNQQMDQIPPERNVSLKTLAKLKQADSEEAAGVLWWLIDGLRLSFSEQYEFVYKLPTTSEIQETVIEHKEQNSSVEGFVASCIEKQADLVADGITGSTLTALYALYLYTTDGNLKYMKSQKNILKETAESLNLKKQDANVFDVIYKDENIKKKSSGIRGITINIRHYDVFETIVEGGTDALEMYALQMPAKVLEAVQQLRIYVMKHKNEMECVIKAQAEETIED